MKRIFGSIISLILVFCMVSSLAVSVNAAGSSIATATAISFDKRYYGNITESNNKDVYKITLSSAGMVNIDLKAEIYKTSYYLYDADGNEVWSKDYQYWNGTSEIFSANWDFDLTKGTYYFAVCRCDGTTGNYNFKATFKSAGESFSEVQGGDNQSIKQADKISLNKTYKGQIAKNDDKDFYKFTLSSAGMVNIDLKAEIYKTSYYLYDADGNEVWSKDYQYWNGTSEIFSANWDFDLTKGTYYFAVCRCDGTTGNYNFKATFKSAGESFSEVQGGDNQSIKQADRISLNKTYKGQIAKNDDKDFYTFTLSKATKINLKLTAYIYKSSYYLYDANGNEVWSKSWQYWNGTSQKLTLNETFSLSAGKYYFAVCRCDGTTGNYSFNINCSHNWKKTVSKKATMSADGNGTQTCNICGKQGTYTIPKIKSVALSTTTYTYNGKVKTPSVIVKDSKGKTLKNGTDYTVSYASGRKNVGTYKVTVKFKGSYSGSKTLSFKIVPASTKITSTSAGSKKFTVKWSKVSSQATGYQVQYSTSSSFSSATTKTVGSYKTTSKTISGLKKGKKYYVRVRTYKKVGDKNYYSSWSSSKSVRTK